MIKLQSIAASADMDTARPLADYADDVMRQVEGVLDGSVVSTVVTTGYADMDRAMNGLEAGTLVLVAGRPGMAQEHGYSHGTDLASIERMLDDPVITEGRAGLSLAADILRLGRLG